MYVSGGLSEEVDEKILHAAFVPFGDVTDINIPLDYETGGLWLFNVYFLIYCAKYIKQFNFWYS